jgi:hypothetical protein
MSLWEIDCSTRMELTGRTPQTILQTTFKHMNKQENNNRNNPNGLSDIEKLKLDAARLSFREDCSVARIYALECMLEEIAVLLLGHSQGFAAFLDRKEQHYEEAMKLKDEFLAHKKPNLN